MGWKNIKEAFDIGHHVISEGGHIHIGSGLVHNLVSINQQTGEVHQNSTFSDFLDRHYPALKSASPNHILKLIRQPDQFAASIPVYTFDDGEIIECQCERPGYPNVTHDGRMMYENRFSTDRDQVIAWAKRDLGIWLRNLNEHVAHLEDELSETLGKQASAGSKLKALNSAYPDIEPEK